MQNEDKQIDVKDPNYDDPILAEIRKIRDEFSERFNGDVDAMSRHFAEQRLLHPIEGMIETVPRRIQSGPSNPQALVRQEKLHAGRVTDKREQPGLRRANSRRAPADP